MKDRLGESFRRFEFKAGNEGFAWGGMLTEGSPSSNPPNRPRLVINGRLLGGEYVERAGLTKFNSSVFHNAAACIRHIDDFQIATPKKLWMRGNGCPDVSTSVGAHLAHIDQEQNPEYQRSVYYDTATNNPILASFDGGLYVGVDADLRKLTLVVTKDGEENLAVGGSSQDRPVHTFTGFVIRCMVAFDGKLFIGLDNGAGASKIATFDGVSVRDDVTAINAPTCFGLYRVTGGGDAIVVGFAAATNAIKYRPTGDSPGSWTNVAPGAGTLSSVAMAPYKDTLYIADDSGEIWTFDGTTLTSAHTPATATAVRGITTFNGFLYFGYETAAAARIGKYDGSTWTDVEKDLTVAFAGTTSIRSLKAYRNSLYAAAVRSSNGVIQFSPETATTGTWTQITPAATAGAINELLVA